MGEKVNGLLGRKIGHSWSAPIHAALGCADYRLIELEPEELGAFLAREDIGGLNVTIPYKRDVMAYCDVLDPMAEAIGSVNTLVRRADGKLYGYNTDAAGFCFMAQRAGIGFAGKKTLVLGSGGASRTAAACVKKLGAREVVVISRSGENNYTNLGRHADAERIVNTTPVGIYPNNGAAAVDLTAFPACAGVLDLIYNPRRTALLLQAEELGIPCSDGLPMLVAQAKAAEEHFFDRLIADRENERILAQLRREMTNLVLIGMPGSGKSTVGAALAALTGREAIDIAARLAEQAGCSIPEIFAKGGEAAFRPGRPPPPGPAPPGRTLRRCGRSARRSTNGSATPRSTTAARSSRPRRRSGGIFVKILVINGPNMNMLGIRQPEIYGHATYEDLKSMIEGEAERLGAEVSFFQSNHEGALVDAIQQAYFDRVDGMIINPAAYTHTSVALLDAVKAVGIPTVEVHVSDPDSREDFRHVSYIRAACIAPIRGHGLPGYLEALHLLCERGEGRG